MYYTYIHVYERMVIIHITLHSGFLRFSLSLHALSVHLRTGTEHFARALLASAYRAFLWSIRGCTVTSPNIGLIQATARRPHDHSFRAKNLSQRVPTLFPTYVIGSDKRVNFAQWPNFCFQSRISSRL